MIVDCYWDYWFYFLCYNLKFSDAYNVYRIVFSGNLSTVRDFYNHNCVVSKAHSFNIIASRC